MQNDFAKLREQYAALIGSTTQKRREACRTLQRLCLQGSIGRQALETLGISFIAFVILETGLTLPGEELTMEAEKRFVLELYKADVSASEADLIGLVKSANGRE